MRIDMKTKSILCSLLTALTLWSCGDKDDKEILEPVRIDLPICELTPAPPTSGEPVVATRHSYKPIELEGGQKKMNASLQEFSWKLFKEVFANREEDTNLMISPISLAIDLGMFLNGVTGTTQQELLKTIGFYDYSMEQVNAFLQTMQTGIENADEAAIFKSANSFWYNQHYKANEAFLNAIKTHYEAEAKAVDFSNPQTAKDINDWCADKTNGRISELLRETSEDDVFHLLNAVYFKASWVDPFEKEETQPQPFHFANGQTADVDMMHLNFETLYLENNLYQMAYKPFVDGAFQMVFILPKENVKMEDAIPTFLANYHNVVRNDITYQLPEVYLVDLYAPKFTSEYTEKHLLEYMQHINPSLQISNNDLKIIDDKDSYSLSASQKTFFLMDEEGAEAAAVTDIADVESVPEPVTMRLDRPFFYAIVESRTLCPLFMGYYGK